MRFGGRVGSRMFVLAVVVSLGLSGLIGLGLGTSAMAQTSCNDVPPYCSPVTGVIHDGSGVGTVTQVADDPSPTAPGIWLGNYASARYCYANYNQFMIDNDHDWLDDSCELQIARAFAPDLAISPTDGCSTGEPYWAAKYFDNGYGWGEFIRIAYMPAYYNDCGSFGHQGDSEFIMIGVQYNGATQHWEVRDAYLSAHAGTVTDSSQYVRMATDLDYPTRSLAYPRIWVAKSKHGNYRNRGNCDSGAFGADTCDDNVSVGRILVYRNRNVGSRFLDQFPNGVPSQNSAFSSNGKVEYFYNAHNFGGWQPNAAGVTPYGSFLMSYVFECYDYTYTFQGTCYWGPGPNPPTSTRMTGVIDGPSQVTAYQTYTWTSFVTGGVRPYQAKWWLKYSSDSSPTLVATTDGAGTAFTAGSWTGTVGRCENFTLTMNLTSADGWTWSNNHPITVTCPPPPLSVYIGGPSVITVKGTYTYSAVTSGFTSPRYAWTERFCDDADGVSCQAWVNIGVTSSSFNRVLSKDCSGTGQKTYWVSVVVTNSDGRTATAQHVTALCQVLL